MKVFCKLTNPFPIAVLDDLFEEQDYLELQRTFPVGREKPFIYDAFEKNNFNESHEDFMPFIRSSPIWQKCGNLMRGAGPLIGKLFDMNFSPKRVKFEFSMLKNGGGLKPHPDSKSKTFTMVFYCPRNDWDPAWGGNFEAVSSLIDPDGDWSGKYAEWNQVETVLSPTFKHNRAVVFMRTNNSLHGVRPISCPENAVRTTCTINYLA